MKQSRLMSLIEVAVNVIVGYVLAIATQIVVFPWFGIQAALREHLTIGLVFVCVSVVRGYLLRRLFERLRIVKKMGQHKAGPVWQYVGTGGADDRALRPGLVEPRAHIA